MDLVSVLDKKNIWKKIFMILNSDYLYMFDKEED